MNKNKKKGFAIELLALSVILIVSVLFFAGWIYGTNLIEKTLTSGDLDIITSSASGTSFTLNVTNATESTLSYVVQGYDQLRLISYIMFIGFLIACLVTGYFMGNHPILIIPYILIALFIIIMSVQVSNAYEDLLTNSVLGTTLQSFSVSNIFLVNLPTIITVVAFLGIALAVLKARYVD